MYGEIPFTAQEEKANTDFVNYQISLFGSRQNAFENLYARAWDYFFRGDYSLAMKRFNQIWLIDPDRPESYLGFGVTLARMGKPQEATKHLRRAAEKYGFGPAQNALGILLDQGAEGAESVPEAQGWYESSEKRGYTGVWRNLRGQKGEVFAVTLDGFKREKGIAGHFHAEALVRRMNDKTMLRWTIKEIAQHTGELYSVISTNHAAEFFKAVNKQPREQVRNGLWLVLPPADLRSEEDERELLTLEKLARENNLPYFQCLTHKLPDGWVRIN